MKKILLLTLSSFFIIIPPILINHEVNDIKTNTISENLSTNTYFDEQEDFDSYGGSTLYNDQPLSLTPIHNGKTSLTEEETLINNGDYIKSDLDQEKEDLTLDEVSLFDINDYNDQLLVMGKATSINNFNSQVAPYSGFDLVSANLEHDYEYAHLHARGSGFLWNTCNIDKYWHPNKIVNTNATINKNKWSYSQQVTLVTFGSGMCHWVPIQYPRTSISTFSWNESTKKLTYDHVSSYYVEVNVNGTGGGIINTINYKNPVITYTGVWDHFNLSKVTNSIIDNNKLKSLFIEQAQLINEESGLNFSNLTYGDVNNILSGNQGQGNMFNESILSSELTNQVPWNHSKIMFLDQANNELNYSQFIGNSQSIKFKIKGDGHNKLIGESEIFEINLPSYVDDFTYLMTTDSEVYFGFDYTRNLGSGDINYKLTNLNNDVVRLIEDEDNKSGIVERSFDSLDENAFYKLEIESDGYILKNRTFQTGISMIPPIPPDGELKPPTLPELPIEPPLEFESEIRILEVKEGFNDVRIRYGFVLNQGSGRVEYKIFEEYQDIDYINSISWRHAHDFEENGSWSLPISTLDDGSSLQEGTRYTVWFRANEIDASLTSTTFDTLIYSSIEITNIRPGFDDIRINYDLEINDGLLYSDPIVTKYKVFEKGINDSDIENMEWINTRHEFTESDSRILPIGDLISNTNYVIWLTSNDGITYTESDFRTDGLNLATLEILESQVYVSNTWAIIPVKYTKNEGQGLINWRFYRESNSFDEAVIYSEQVDPSRLARTIDFEIEGLTTKTSYIFEVRVDNGIWQQFIFTTR